MKFELHDVVRFCLDKHPDSESDVMEGEIVEMSSSYFTRSINLVVLSDGEKYYIQKSDVMKD